MLINSQDGWTQLYKYLIRQPAASLELIICGLRCHVTSTAEGSWPYLPSMAKWRLGLTEPKKSRKKATTRSYPIMNRAAGENANYQLLLHAVPRLSPLPPPASTAPSADRQCPPPAPITPLSFRCSCMSTTQGTVSSSSTNTQGGQPQNNIISTGRPQAHGADGG